MIKKFCDICGKEEEPRMPLMQRPVYTECTPNGMGNKRINMEVCDYCNVTLSNAGQYPKIVAEVSAYKELKSK